MTRQPYQNIYSIVKQIPVGKIATYGQIARLAGMPNHARQVGYALAASGDINIPWQRVVNASGEISKRKNPDIENYQRMLLEAEGIKFDLNNRINLKRFLWNGSSD